MVLQDVPQLRSLIDLQKRFRVRFMIHGGLPHRLALAETRSESLDLFETSSLLGDIDIIHAGDQRRTAQIIEGIFDVIPTPSVSVGRSVPPARKAFFAGPGHSTPGFLP
jgi:hypothetical protein